MEVPDSFAVGHDPSPIEDKMAVLLRTYLAPEVTVVPEHQCRTPWGTFRLDFRVTGPGDRVALGVECDGAEFHDDELDFWRDAVIIGERHVRSIVRFTGSDISYRGPEVMHWLAYRYPSLFTRESHRLLCERIARGRVDRSRTPAEETEDLRDREISPTHRPSASSSIAKTAHWPTAHRFAQDHGPGPIATVCDAWRRANGLDPRR